MAQFGWDTMGKCFLWNTDQEGVNLFDSLRNFIVGYFGVKGIRRIKDIFVMLRMTGLKNNANKHNSKNHENIGISKWPENKKLGLSPLKSQQNLA
jgi:hypothetical protein